MPQTHDNQGRANLAVIGLAVTCLVVAALVFVNILLLIAVEGRDREQVRDLLAFGVWLPRSLWACIAFTAVVFIRWVHRAFGNALAMGERSQWSQGWAIGAWFVPLLNLVAPFQIVTAIRRNAERLTGKHSSGAIVAVWWSSLIAARVGGWVIQFVLLQSGLASSLTHLVGILVVFSTIELMAGCCAIVMVRRLTSLQQQASVLDVARAFDLDPSDALPPPPAAHRRQVVGSECDDCGRPIASISDAVGCRTCTGAFHRRCAPTAICVKCGGDDLVRGVAVI